MSWRRRVLLLTLIMVAVAICVTGVTLGVLYRAALQQERARLRTVVESRARLMEAVARFDRVQSADYPGGPTAASLSQILEAHRHYKGAGRTDEIMLARREGDSIVFLFTHGRGGVTVPASLPFDSELAEPMRRALAGVSGTVIGPDYEGHMVVAAYEPVRPLHLGLVAKVDLAEVREPFIHAGLLAVVIQCTLLLIAAFLFQRISAPMVERLEAHAQELQAEVRHRKVAEARLRVLSSRNEALLAAIPDIVMEMDTHKVYTWANPAGLAFFGEDCIGREAAQYFEGEQRTYQTVQPLFEGADEVIHVESRQRRQDGEKRLLAWWCRALKDADGTVTGALSTARDITQQRQAEEELRGHRDHLEELVAERTRQLEAANQELEAFCYSVSHDLRAPLRSMDGFSQALLEDCGDTLDEHGKHYLHRVRRASQRMARLIDDLLNLSRISRHQLRRQAVDLSALARAIAAELHQVQPERRVEFVIPGGLVANGDPQLLRVALQNLLDNAWKFSGTRPAARIEFGLANHNGTSAYFVRDDGVGFDMAYADKLFQPFHRLHSDADFEGTGIGLATVQRIIRRHGGRIWAEADVGRGASFYFTL